MERERLSLDFWKFWTGQTISSLGSSFTFFALPLLVYKLTGSPLNLAMTTAAAFVPYLLFGLVIGAWVDRVDRRRLMIAVDVGRAAAIASIPVASAAGVLDVWWVYGVAFFNSTLTIAFDAAQFAAIPSLVGRRDLVTANGRIQASYNAMQVAGPLLAGGGLAVVSIEVIFLVDAASFLASGVALGLVRRSFNAPPDEAREPTSVFRDVGAGLAYVVRHPVLRNISLMMAIVNFFGTTAMAQLVFLAKERFEATDTQVGVLFSAGSFGIVVLSLAAGRLRRRLAFSKAALGGLMAYGVLVVGLGLVPSYWLAVPVWAACMGFAIFFNINTTSLRQAITPSHLLGRVMTIAAVLAWSANPLGALAGAWAIKATDNVALVYTGVGVSIFVVAAGFAAFSALGRAEEYLPESEPAPAQP